MILAVPSVLYFFLVARIAVYDADRYIQPIYGVVIAAGLCALYYILHTVFNKKTVADLCTVAVAVYMLICSWNILDITPFNVNDEEISYSGYDVICFYDYYAPQDIWQVQSDFMTFKDCDSITFVSTSGFDYLYENGVLENDELFVVILDDIDDPDFYLASVVAVSQNLEGYEKIDRGGYSDIYYLK